MMGFGLLWILLVIVGVAVGVPWLARQVSSSSQASNLPSEGSPDNPLEILDQRYAKGEISREEYLVAKKDLK